MSELKLEQFTNDFGQVISPGEEVVYAGTAWKSTSFRKAKFGGVYYATVYKYLKKEDGSVFYGSVVEPIAVKVYDILDKRYKWDNVKRQGEYVDCMRTAYLPLKRVFKLDTNINDFVEKKVRL